MISIFDMLLIFENQPVHGSKTTPMETRHLARAQSQLQQSESVSGKMKWQIGKNSTEEMVRPKKVLKGLHKWQHGERACNQGHCLISHRHRQ